MRVGHSIIDPHCVGDAHEVTCLVGPAMTDPITRANYDATPADLELMVLEQHQLPGEVRGFRLGREGELDNDTMANQGFPGNTGVGFARLGRITGFHREFVVPSSGEVVLDGSDVAVATVAHLFTDEDAVSRWMSDVFVGQFEKNVGKPVGADQRLESVERVTAAGFQSDAVGLRAVQSSSHGLLSSTVLDFRVGRVLGVAFTLTVGDHERIRVTESLASELERQIVRVLLR